MWDSLILMVMALVVFGPRRLPEIGRKMGRIMYELRKASNDFKFQMEEELRKVDEADQRKKEEARLATLALAAPVDSQVQNSGPDAPIPSISESETPVVNAPAPVESPYPGEDVYPPVIAAESEAPAEEAVSSIQPPSETPAAVPADESIPVTEPARHD